MPSALTFAIEVLKWEESAPQEQPGSNSSLSYLLEPAACVATWVAEPDFGSAFSVTLL